jgi:hypothetical protein
MFLSINNHQLNLLWKIYFYQISIFKKKLKFREYKFFEKAGKCDQCQMDISTLNSFYLFEPRDFLSTLFSNTKLREAMLLQNEKNKKNPEDIFKWSTKIDDISTGYVYHMFRKNEKFKCSEYVDGLIIFIDAIPVNNGKNPNIYMIKAMLSNLNAENERSKEKYLITLGCFQQRGECHHSILKPVITLLQFFYYNDINIEYMQYDQNFFGVKNSIKVRLIPMVWIMDKASSWVLGMVTSQAYLSCWSCLIAGHKNGKSNMFFPFIGKDKKVALRDTEWEILCCKRAEQLKKDYYGGLFFLISKIIIYLS